MVALSLPGIPGQAHADHPTIAFGSEAAGPIGTIPTAPTGGDIIFLSPGVRVSSSDTWSLFLSVGKSVYHDLNGRQTDVDYRLVGGFVF